MKTLLKRSLEESYPVEIIYQSKNNQFSKRTILIKAINDTYVNYHEPKGIAASEKEATWF